MSEIVLNEENFENEVIASDKPVIVDFWATWCGPCKMIAPEIEAIAESCKDKVKVGKVNVDDCENLAIKYNVSLIPTVMLFKGGNVIKTSVGYKTKDELLSEFGI